MIAKAKSKSKPIVGKLTVEGLAKSARTWLSGGRTTPCHVVGYYRDLYGLTPYRAKQLRSLLG